jgi:hypothetical protein
VIAEQFTPGPWEIESRVGSGKNDYAVSPAIGNDGFVCALTHGPDAQANARLIAAAPDLYSALDAVNEEILLDGHLQELVEAALAKARGEQ